MPAKEGPFHYGFVREKGLAVGLTMTQKQAVTKEMASRYRKGPKKTKGGMLDELCALTGWTRDHARRVLRRTVQGSAPRPARTRTSIYGDDLLEPLQRIWATLDGPCGKRMAPFMGEIIEAMERWGELELTDAQRDRLTTISAATIDRRLASARQHLKIKGRSGTKPGSMLKHQIAIRTFSEWDDTVPGFIQCDLVAHDGGDPNGEFCQTLDVTDVASGWTELRAVKNKAQRWVFEALADIETTLPFDLRGIDSDNGAEFINNHLVRYCSEHKITFTRSRPYRKNDSCFVEQKNWTVVRQSVGYLRYDTDREQKVLNELYGYLRLYVNFFQPQMRLIEKTRNGARVHKRYDSARTPFRRLLDSDIPGARQKALSELFETLNPVQLKRDIARCQDRLLKVARRKQPPRKGVKQPTRTRTSEVRQRRDRSRAS